MELSPWHLPRPGTSDFILDDIVSIEPDGIEEVFDVQVERTENFIANGLVSHNTWWAEDDWAGRIQQVMKKHEDDEAGGDNKLLAVPIDKILSIYSGWKKPEDLNPLRLETIRHFFEHYKDLEPGKWVKVKGWGDPDAARAEVATGIANHRRQRAG